MSEQSANAVGGTGTFTLLDWALLGGVSLIWGSSFLWIAIGLDSYPPLAVAFGRCALGAAAVWALPGARQPLPRSAWASVLGIGLIGNAAPALLFAIAQRSVASSIAGMINAATPLAVLVIGIVAFGQGPSRLQRLGLLTGFGGVALMAVPSAIGESATPRGVVLLCGAVMCYGVSNNLLVPLQRVYGSAAVIAWALLIAAAALAPVGLPQLVLAKATIASFVAIAILGILGTGAARSGFASLAGRVGAARASTVTYLVPVVAVALGVTARGEEVAPEAVGGIALVLASAMAVSRGASGRPATAALRARAESD